MAEDRISRRLPDMPTAWERMNEMWRSLMGRPLVGASREGLWHPTVDVYERADDVVVQVELPGMKGQKMDVSLEEDHLIIEGSRPQVAEYAEEDCYYSERPTGSFHRIVHLPASVDEAATVAHYDDGVLTITMPKAERERARRIEIK
ncbi:MAG: Hsp20/alpha crystallin family protein [Planctomycetota bacterium]